MTTPPTPFADRARAAMRRCGPLCAGLDPTPALLTQWGLPDDVNGLRRFSEIVLEAWAGRVAFIKPQSAYFERHGAAGFAVLEEVVQTLASTDTLAVLDAKRSDIGSSLEAYAQAYLADGAAMAVDALTLSPYLGYESLRPAIDLAAATGRGVFVLALTSNPEGARVQHHGSPALAATIVSDAAADNDRLTRSGPHGPGDQRRLGPVGLVVGATIGDAAARLDIDLARSGALLLVPGLGAQGAGPADLPATFGAALHQVIPVVSRGLLAHGPGISDLRREAESWNRRLIEAIGNGSADSEE